MGVVRGAVLTNSDFGSLKAAVSQGGTITLAFSGTVTFTNTLLVAKDTTLDATGYVVTFHGGDALRHFVVTNQSTLQLINLTLANGRFAGLDGLRGASGLPGLGGSILCWGGNLKVFGCHFKNNNTVGGNGGQSDVIGGIFQTTTGAPGYGGGIYLSEGSIWATNCVFANNSATGGHGINGDVYTAPGSDAFGGAIYSTNSVANLVGTTFSSNSVIAGPLWGGRAMWGSGRAWGGAVAASSGSALISNCLFVVNQAVGGTRVWPEDSGSANGGALFHQGGSMTIQATELSRNAASGGGGFSRGGYMLSAWGNGGAIFNQSGSLRLHDSALTMNQANGGPVTVSAPWPAEAGPGSGGGIYSSGTLTLSNCTLAENSANGGAGLENHFGPSGTGGPGYGGAIYLAGGNAGLVNVTMAANTVSPGALGNPEVLGASILAKQGSIALTNSIVACSAALTNVSGTLMDGGHNLCSDASANFTSPTSRHNLNPLLGSLGYYGGAAPTFSLLPASPAIDAGDDAACPVTDQRGIPRPKGGACDIGAFELAPNLSLAPTSGGLSLVLYAFQAGRTNFVSKSMDFSAWRSLGIRVADTNGVFEIEQIDVARTPLGFYKVEMWQAPHAQR